MGRPSSRHATVDAWSQAGSSNGTPSRVDLHAHTLRSDGLLTPAELVRAAADAGVRLLAITDHDTLAGYREVATRPEGLPTGLELVPGVEINAMTGGDPALADSEIHVLGLGVDPANEAFEALLARQRAGRRVRFEKMIERLAGLGLDLREALERTAGPGHPGRPSEGHDALGRPTVGRALIAIGAVATVEEAFDRYLSRGRPGYVAREGIGPHEAIRAINAAGGLASLAHFWSAAERPKVATELIDAGLRGIEVHHPSFEPATVAAVGEVARRFGLVATAGTDYHGDLGTYAEAHARLEVPPTLEAGVRAALGR